MKKIALAIAMATSASFASAQLTFDPDSPISDVQACDFIAQDGVDSGTCSTAAFNYGLAAFNAQDELINAEQEVVSSFEELEADEATLVAAQQELAALPALQGQDLIDAQDAVDSAQTGVENAQTTYDARIEAEAAAQAAFAIFTGEVADTAIAINLAERVAQEASNSVFDLNGELFDAQVTLGVAEGVRDAAVLDTQDKIDIFNAAAAAYAADPEDELLLQARLDAAADVVAASDLTEAAIVAVTTAGASVTDAGLALNDAIAISDTADTALSNLQGDYQGLIDSWEINYDTAVIAEQDDVNAAQVALEQENQDLATANTSNAAASVDLVAKEAALDIALQAELDAEQAELDAEAAVIEAQQALVDATPEETVAAQQDLADKIAAEVIAEADHTAAEAAVVAATTEVDIADALVTTTDNDVVLAIADVATAEGFLNSEQAEVDSLSAEIAEYASYAGDSEDPANALLTALIIGEGNDAEAVVEAINSTVELTESNDVDIAANTDAISANAELINNSTTTNSTAIGDNAGLITTNATNIATNATDIATNATDIATNATDIATNVTNIATNATDIATNVTNIATNADGHCY